MNRIYLTILLCVIALVVNAQYNDAEYYTDSSEFEVGDIIRLNSPSKEGKYRSVSYTFQAAKNILQNLTEESYQPLYLSAQFSGAEFILENIVDSVGILGYGEQNQFAILDLALAIKTGEVGDQSKIKNIWNAEEATTKDFVLLKKIEQERYQSVFFHPAFLEKLELNQSDRVYLPGDLNGSTLNISNTRKKLSRLGNDSTESFALADLSLGLDLDEIEILKDTTLTQLIGTPTYDSLLIADSLEKVTIFQKWGVFPYVFPLVEFSPETISLFSYGGGFGVTLKQKWQLGAYLQVYEGGFTDRVLFPNSFALDYTYGGVFAGYQVYQKGDFRFSVQAKLGAGESSWTLEESGEILDTDDFFVINPRISADYPLNGFSMLNLTFGYRILSGFDLVTLDNGSLSNFTLSAALKIGWFN